MKHIAYLKIGRNRGKSRIWMEGIKLESANFLVGKSISVEFNKSKKIITLSLSKTGSRVVCQRSRKGVVRPIIDLQNAGVGEVFKGVRKIKVVFLLGKIIITVHPDEEARLERLERLKNKLNRGESLSCGSIAHGGGIMDNAIHAGLKDINIPSSLGFGVEIEKKYLECSLRNNPIWTNNSLAIQAPMEEVELSDLPKVEIFEAGIPCTGASLAGRAKNKLGRAEEHESAGALFLAFLNIVKACNPCVVVLENVPQYANTASMTVIRNTLNTWGYQIHETVLNGNEMGALENRNRFVMIAVTEDLEIDLQELIPVRQKESQLNEILDDISPDDPMWREFGYLKAKEISDKKAGKGFAMHVVKNNATSCNCIGKGYAKIRSTELKVSHPTNKNLMRQLTVAEHAKVKGIPVGLVSGCSNTVGHEILGQSIIFPAFVAIGRLVGSVIQGWFNSIKNIVETSVKGQRSLFELLAA
jgi:DNA (cytosine-5)-methyltransferase 1